MLCSNVLVRSRSDDTVTKLINKTKDRQVVHKSSINEMKDVLGNKNMKTVKTGQQIKQTDSPERNKK